MPAVLFVCMVADSRRLAEVDTWYDRDHRPGRLAIPGFRRAIRYREDTDAAVRASACIYDLESEGVLRSARYLHLQAETARDTAVHLRGVELHRVSGEGDAALPAEPGPVLLAAIEPVRRRAPTRIGTPAVAADPRVARYAGEWQGSPCVLVLHDLPDTSADPGRLAGDGAARWWLLRRVGVPARPGGS